MLKLKLFITFSFAIISIFMCFRKVYQNHLSNVIRDLQRCSLTLMLNQQHEKALPCPLCLTINIHYMSSSKFCWILFSLVFFTRGHSQQPRNLTHASWPDLNQLIKKLFFAFVGGTCQNRVSYSSSKLKETRLVMLLFFGMMENELKHTKTMKHETEKEKTE